VVFVAADPDLLGLSHFVCKGLAPAINARGIGTIQRGGTLIHTEHAGHKAVCEKNVNAHHIRWPIGEEMGKAVDMADTVPWWRRQSRWRTARDRRLERVGPTHEWYCKLLGCRHARSFPQPQYMHALAHCSNCLRHPCTKAGKIASEDRRYTIPGEPRQRLRLAVHVNDRRANILECGCRRSTACRA